MLKKSNHFLFHAMLKSFRAYHLQGKHLLVGVSGGLDSMTLLSVLLSLRSILKLKLSVVYVHHGSKDKKQRVFQDQALKMVQGFCHKNHLPFYFNPLCGSKLTDKSGTTYFFSHKARSKKMVAPFNPLCGSKLTDKSGTTYFFSHKARSKKMVAPFNPLCGSKLNEASMRAYRYQVFLKYFRKSQADFLTLAHTADDLLETQLLRLIRGTGPIGIGAMRFKRGCLLRPLIDIRRQKLKDYALKNQLTWCEDPSNQSTKDHLRNWIRQKWLPLLEKKQPGALKTMARSLNLLAYSVGPNQIQIQQLAKTLIKEGALKRDKWLVLPLSTRQKILAYYLKEQGMRNYSLGHIKEILKQLERKQKNFQFFLLGKTWAVSPRFLKPLLELDGTK